MHDWLLADNVALGEFANNTGYILLFNAAVSDLIAEFLCSFGMLADEHNATCEAVQPVAGEGVPLMTPFRTHDFDDGVVVITAGRMHRNTGRFVDNNHVVVFVHYAN